MNTGSLEVESNTEVEARRQRLRLKRFGLATATFTLWVAFVVYADLIGLFDLRLGGLTIPVWALVAVMVASNLVFYFLFKSGANLQFGEPSLTLPMMIVALVWAVITAGGLPEARAISFPAFIIVFMFGVFNLRVSGYAVCWVFAMVGYALMVYATVPDAAPVARIQMEVMQAVLLGALLFWIAFFGRYVGVLRVKLSERNKELHQALALVEELAVRDDLTGLHNRRFVMGALEREQQRADRHGSTFSLLLLDLDDFKQVNDQFGHAGGDAVLKGFVKRLAREVRRIDLVGHGSEPDDTDTIGRFGGEEFLIVLPDTPSAGARRVGERIRRAVAAEPFDIPGGAVAVTVSIGMAEYRRGESVRDILERVDRALYAAKHAGRNRLAGAAPDHDGTPMILTEA